MRAETLEKLRHQAELQLRGRRTGTYVWELLPDEPERGFRLLPEPNEGDVWLDLEGHPFYETARGSSTCSATATGTSRARSATRPVGRDREGERRCSSDSSTGSSNGGDATRVCTSTTTPRTSEQRSRA